MVIGVLQFELVVPGSQCLKDKRRVVKSLKDRLHREQLVSIAEIAALDHHRLAVMGCAVVSNSVAHAGAVLDRVVAKLRSLHNARLESVSREILTGDAIHGNGEDLWDESERRDADGGAEAEGEAAA